MSHEIIKTKKDCKLLGVVGALFVGILHLLNCGDVGFLGSIGRFFVGMILGVAYIFLYISFCPSESFCFKLVKQHEFSKLETIQLFKECRKICIVGLFVNFGLALLSSIYHDSLPVFCIIVIPLLVLPICVIIFNFNVLKYCDKLYNPLYTSLLENSETSDDFNQSVLVYEQEKERMDKRIEKQKAKRIARETLIAEGVVFDNAAKRPTIPRDVVDAVWIRDKGKCVYCGSTENLQLDHIIPFSKGGATTVENLQLLCQKCNIRKSNHIGNE